MILVTGATGLVGTHILHECRARGWSVTALVRDEASAGRVRRLGAEPTRGSVDDRATWQRIGGVSAIIHAAALITARAGWDDYERVNVGSVRLAAERARQLGVPLIHISSVAVYGREDYTGEPGSLTESFPFGSLQDRQVYPRSKRLAEQVLWDAAAGGLRAMAFRPSVIYGEGDRQFLPRIVALARLGALPVFGRVPRPLTMVHGRNVALAVVQAISLDRGWGQAFNLVNDDVMTAPELIAAVRGGLGRPVRQVTVPLGVAEAAAGLADRVLGLLPSRRFPTRFRGAIDFWRGGNPYSVEAARRELEWSPVVRHREGVPAAVRAIAGGGD